MSEQTRDPIKSLITGFANGLTKKAAKDFGLSDSTAILTAAAFEVLANELLEKYRAKK